VEFKNNPEHNSGASCCYAAIIARQSWQQNCTVNDQLSYRQQDRVKKNLAMAMTIDALR
jgi:hypothetical protein